MISVIVPLYNNEKYIKECLDSILAQTYQDYEIIVINDGSTDNSSKIIEKYYTKNEKIRYFYQENGGPARARNFGVKMAKGEYLMFVDSDDYLAIDSMELIMDRLKGFDADMGIMGHIRFDESNPTERKSYLFDLDDGKCYSNMEVLNLVLTFNIKGYCCDKVFSREKWNQFKIWCDEDKYCEDWFPTSKYIINAEKIVFINKGLYYYRQRENSLIHTSNIRVMQDYNLAARKIVDYIESKSIRIPSLETFKMISFLETIHELYLNSEKRESKIYKELKISGLNQWAFSFFEILKNEDLTLKNKIALILWKLKLYHIFKKFFKKLY